MREKLSCVQKYAVVDTLHTLVKAGVKEEVKVEVKEGITESMKQYVKNAVKNRPLKIWINGCDD